VVCPPGGKTRAHYHVYFYKKRKGDGARLVHLVGDPRREAEKKSSDRLLLKRGRTHSLTRKGKKRKKGKNLLLLMICYRKEKEGTGSFSSIRRRRSAPEEKGERGGGADNFIRSDPRKKKKGRRGTSPLYGRPWGKEATSCPFTLAWWGKREKERGEKGSLFPSHPIAHRRSGKGDVRSIPAGNLRKERAGSLCEGGEKERK